MGVALTETNNIPSDNAQLGGDPKMSFRSQIAAWIKTPLFGSLAALTVLAVIYILPGISEGVKWIIAHLMVNASFQDSYTESLDLAKDHLIATVYFTFALFVSLALFAHGAVLRASKFEKQAKKSLSEISRRHQESEDRLKKSRLQLDQLSDFINSDGSKEHIRVAVFDNLLAYAPLYVAKGMGYFDDEKLDVEFVPVHGDKEIAEGLASHAYPFGIGDPIVSLASCSLGPQIKILAPLSKRLDITPFVKRPIFEKMLRGEIDDAPITILTYPPKTTCYATALHLKNSLELLGVKEIHFKDLPPNSPVFHNPDELVQQVREVDLALLWNPASLWMEQHLCRGDDPEFGILATTERVSRMERDPGHWTLISPSDEPAPEGVPEASVRPWHPMNSAPEGHRLMATAVLTSSYMIENRPQLCRRFFRALTKALIRIEGADWHVDGTLEDNRQLWSCVRHELDTRGAGAYAERTSLERLVNNQYYYPARSVFPFIDGVQKYDYEKYSKHLANMDRFWRVDNDLDLSSIADVNTLSDYAKFFIKSEDIKKSAS